MTLDRHRLRSVLCMRLAICGRDNPCCQMRKHQETSKTRDPKSKHLSLPNTLGIGLGLAVVGCLSSSAVMGFIKDKVVAPLAGQAARHTSPGLGHQAVDALGADKVAKTMSNYLGPEASVKMIDDAGPEHLADVLGADNMAQLLIDIVKQGDPKNRQVILSMGPMRMATMLKSLGITGAVQCVQRMGPANTAATTITVPGPQLGADLFRGLGDSFAAQLMTGLGPVFVGALMRGAGSAGAGGFLRGMGAEFAASLFQHTGADFLGQVFMIMEADYAGPVLAAAGVDFDAALFNMLGPRYVARLMHKTGAQYQAEMLRALGVDNSTRLFQLAGAPFVADLLKALGADFNAVLVNSLGKGAVLLGIDLGASFLAEVASHSNAGFLATLAAATTGELVANTADKLAERLNLKGPAATTTIPLYASDPYSPITTGGNTSTAATTELKPLAVTAVTAPDAEHGGHEDHHHHHHHLLPHNHHAEQHQDVYLPRPVPHTGGIIPKVPAQAQAATKGRVAVTAAPAGPVTDEAAGMAVSDGLKELMQHNTTQQPVRIIVRPTSPVS